MCDACVQELHSCTIHSCTLHNMHSYAQLHTVLLWSTLTSCHIRAPAQANLLFSRIACISTLYVHNRQQNATHNQSIGLILWACQVSQTVKPSALLMLFTLLFECLKTLHLHLNITSQTSNWLIWGQLESQCVKPQLRCLAQIWFHLQPGLTSHCELQKAYKVTCMYHSRAARLMMVERCPIQVIPVKTFQQKVGKPFLATGTQLLFVSNSDKYILQLGKIQIDDGGDALSM